MSGIAVRCLEVTVGAALLAVLLLVAGIPVAVLIAVAPVALCVGLHLAFDHGDPDGAELFELARRQASGPAAPPTTPPAHH